MHPELLLFSHYPGSRFTPAGGPNTKALFFRLVP
jgi:hypothetical protein